MRFAQIGRGASQAIEHLQGRLPKAAGETRSRQAQQGAYRSHTDRLEALDLRTGPAQYGDRQWRQQTHQPLSTRDEPILLGSCQGQRCQRRRCECPIDGYGGRLRTRCNLLAQGTRTAEETKAATHFENDCIGRLDADAWRVVHGQSR